jgi:hypothetical protein
MKPKRLTGAALAGWLGLVACRDFRGDMPADPLAWAGAGALRTNAGEGGAGGETEGDDTTGGTHSPVTGSAGGAGSPSATGDGARPSNAAGADGAEPGASEGGGGPLQGGTAGTREGAGGGAAGDEGTGGAGTATSHGGATSTSTGGTSTGVGESGAANGGDTSAANAGATNRGGDTSAADAGTTNGGDTSAADGGGGGVTVPGSEPCDPMAPFASVSRLMDIDSLTTAVNGAWLTADGLSLYLSAEHPSNDDLYVVTRPDTASPFGALEPISAMNTPGIERYPVLSPDGSWLFFTSDRGGNLDLYLARRADPRAPFVDAFPLTALNTPSREDSGSWTSDGRTLYFDSANDLYRVSIDAEGNVGVAEPLSELNGAARESHPVIAADELSIYWSTPVPGTGYDVFMATRPHRDHAFSEPIHLRKPSSRATDYPTFVTADNCTLLLLQEVVDTDYDLLIAERQPP